MARFFREDFDRDREFVVDRAFTFDAVRYEPHPTKAVDKSRFTLRRLRQLYDMRNLTYAPPGVSFKPTPVEEAPKVERYRPGIVRRRLVSTEASA